MGLRRTFVGGMRKLLRTDLKPAIFLDRDGTLIKELNGRCANRADEVDLMPGVAQGLKLLGDHGFKLVVVTNQGGLAKGYLTIEDLHGINDRLQDLLSVNHSTTLDAFYWCPHYWEQDPECGCRKPLPGMITEAAKDLGLDLHRSIMFGDRDSDMLAAKNAGIARRFLIGGKKSHHHTTIMKDFLSAASFAVAVMKFGMRSM